MGTAFPSSKTSAWTFATANLYAWSDLRAPANRHSSMSWAAFFLRQADRWRSTAKLSRVPTLAVSWFFKSEAFFPGSLSKATSVSASRSFQTPSANSGSPTTFNWSVCSRLQTHSYQIHDLSRRHTEATDCRDCHRALAVNPDILYLDEPFRRARFRHPPHHAR